MLSGQLHQQKQVHDAKDKTTDDDVVTVDHDILETPMVGNRHKSWTTVTCSISRKPTSGEKIDLVISQAVETNTNRKNKLLELHQHKVELQKQREERKRKVEHNKEMEIEAKMMAEDNRVKELEQQPKHLEMEQEKHDAAMRHQQAQLDALNANQKSTQEVNLKVLEFMAMMANKLGDK